MKVRKNLRKFLRKLLLGYDVPAYYFAQAGEDAILQFLFQKKLKKGEKGFYIDIGAYHPTHHSVTYFFYLNGWTGINIDPSPGGMKLFKKIKPKDLNLEIGISDKSESLTYFLIDEESTMNSFSKELLVKNGVFQNVKEEIQIPVRPLSDVLEENSGRFDSIDLLSVDVEGYDMEVLASNDWRMFRPNVIAVELECSSLKDTYENQSTKFLVSKGYTPVAKNVILRDIATVFFVSDTFEY